MTIRSRPAAHPTPTAVSSSRWTVTYAVASVSVLLGGVFVLLRDELLPPRFSYDAVKIEALTVGQLAVDDDSYSVVASLYRAIGLAGAPELAAWVGYVTAIVILVAVLRLSTRYEPTKATPVVIAFTVLCSAVYLGAYSKELFVLPIVFSLIAARSRRWVAFSVILMLAYAASFRTYWFVVAGLFVAVHWALGRLTSRRYMVPLIGASLVLLAVAYQAATGSELSEIRAGVNSGRLDGVDASTRIDAFVNGTGLVAQSANVILTFAALVLPIPLLMLGSAYHAVIAAVIAGLWGYFFYRLFAGMRSGEVREDPLKRRSAALLLAFIMVQAMFEPDYGSALRHVVPLLPLLVVLSLGRRLVPVESGDRARAAGALGMLAAR